MEPRVDEFERALARRLWEAGVPEAPLRALLAEVERRRDLSLAAAVVTRGLAPAPLVERSLHELGATPRAAEPRPEAGLADYEVTGVLGQGGMGVVHEVRHRTTGVRYALKRTLPAADPQERARLIREAELLARLDHPGLVRVHSADFSGEAPAFVLELLEGGSLQERLRTGLLPLAEAKRVMGQIADAVGYLHGKGILHRDLKPLNVLFDERGNARLTDFGLARARGAMTLTQTGELLGTPGYMAPEQILDPRRVDARSDVYALGAILFALLTGRPPFQAGTALATLDQVLQHKAPTLAKYRGDDEASALEGLCARALAKDPAERPQTAEAFAAALLSEAQGARPGRLALLAGGSIALALALGALATRALATRERPGPSLAESQPLATSHDAAASTPTPTASLADVSGPAGPVPVDLESLRLQENLPHGFARLHEIVKREQSLLERLYPDMACARRDAALIAAVGEREKPERWFGESKRGATEREKRARRWYRVSTRGERRALRDFANDGRPKPEKRHLLWLAALSGGESGWVDLVTHNSFGDLALANAQIVVLESMGGGPIRRTPEERVSFPTPEEARELLSPVLPGLRSQAPLSRAKWDLGRLSPATIAHRINALLARLVGTGQAEWLAASRARALDLTPAKVLPGSDPRVTLFASAQRSKNLYLYLASALRGSAAGLGRFVRLTMKQTSIGGPDRARALQALVLAVVAFDSPSADPQPLKTEVASSGRFRSLHSVLRALELKKETAALVAIRRSLRVPFGDSESRRAGLSEPLDPERAWGVLEPLLEVCLAIERGEVGLDALDPLVPR